MIVILLIFLEPMQYPVDLLRSLDVVKLQIKQLVIVDRVIPYARLVALATLPMAQVDLGMLPTCRPGRLQTGVGYGQALVPGF